MTISSSSHANRPHPATSPSTSPMDSTKTTTADSASTSSTASTTSDAGTPDTFERTTGTPRRGTVGTGTTPSTSPTTTDPALAAQLSRTRAVQGLRLDPASVFARRQRPSTSPQTPPASPTEPLSIPRNRTGDVVFRYSGTKNKGPSLELSEGVAKGKIESGPYAGAGVTLTGRLDTETGNMNVMAQFKLEAGSQLGASVKGGVGEVSTMDRMGVRGRVKYDLQVTPDQFQAYVDDPSTLPNPLDPSSLPVGSSMVIASEGFHTQEAKAKLRGVFGAENLESREGVGVGIKRLDENTVNVTVGPHAELQRRMRMGVDVGKFSAELVLDQKVAQSQAQSFNLDLSTPEGRQAYDNLLQNGTLPDATTPGVSDWQRVERVKADHSLSAGVGWGDAFAGFTINDTQAELTRRHLGDGNVEQSFVGRSRTGIGVAMSGTGPEDAAFSPDHLDIEVPDAQAASSFLQVSGMPYAQVQQQEGPVRVRITPENYQTLRQNAFANLDQQVKRQGYTGPDPSTLPEAERLAVYERFIPPIGSGTQTDLALARNDNLTGFARFAANGMTTPGGLFEGLTRSMLGPPGGTPLDFGAVVPLLP